MFIEYTRRQTRYLRKQLEASVPDAGTARTNVMYVVPIKASARDKVFRSLELKGRLSERVISNFPSDERNLHGKVQGEIDPILT